MKSAVLQLPGLNRDRDMIAALLFIYVTIFCLAAPSVAFAETWKKSGKSYQCIDCGSTVFASRNSVRSPATLTTENSVKKMLNGPYRQSVRRGLGKSLISMTSYKRSSYRGTKIYVAHMKLKFDWGRGSGVDVVTISDKDRFRAVGIIAATGDPMMYLGDHISFLK